MTSKMISIAREFSPSPAGRYLSDGPFPGEKFRDEVLWPALNEGKTVTVDLDGAEGYGSSFLEEVFGGLIRKGLTESTLRTKLRIQSSRRSYEERIWNYIHKAAAEFQRV